jgi:RimJ/RimL family protein N-acetyltransferase
MITLRRMDESEFQSFLAGSIPSYAADKIRSGNWSEEEAERKSREEHTRLLHRGLDTPSHFLYTIEFDQKPVGHIWLTSDPKTAGSAGFIYDLYIEEEVRGQGLATQALRLLEEEASRLCLSRLSLHVFGFNEAAIALYKKLGYKVTNLNMSKDLINRIGT